MAARRGKSQARRSGGGNSGLPGWAWLVIGVLIALVAVLAAPKFIGDGQKGEGGFFRIGGPQPNPDAQPKGNHEPDGAFDPATAARTPPPPAKTTTEKPTGFDFYEVLPGEEVAMTDAQLAAIQKEEARRQAAADAAAKAANQDAANQAVDAHARAVAAASGQALPRPINESGAQPAPAGNNPPVAPPPAPPASQAARAETAARPANATPYILQAGAFQANGDAEATKARIALLGLNARVESADIGGKTVFRVRMGPYASATELADAKQKLANGGLSAVAIKSK
ncbi:sporulation protein [Lysobacter pythonis]|uniref:Sporulation protein n=1 Tax=Solilutibacter pythonis TaxID=2483112 RepID=A0A3M2HND2_9GAMM|nr:SPOR domain-containing protein [Lysobacter pythonis]RMH89070.1 sporulation protein [Lysobacter pythonis]